MTTFIAINPLHVCLFEIELELIMPFDIILQAMGIETESRAQPQKEHVTISAAAAQPLPGFTSHVCQSTFNIRKRRLNLFK